MKTVLLLLGGLLLSCIAIRLWIGFVDLIKGMLKKLNPFAKKETIVWHTLDEKAMTKEVNRDQIISKDETITESQRYH